MKRISVILIALAVSGCTLWDAYFMAGYDPNEYMLITQIRTQAQTFKTQCEQPNADQRAKRMAYQTRLFENYSEQIPRNDNGIKAAEGLNEIAQGLTQAYTKGTPSPTFCKLKYSSIENSAAVIQHVVGNRPR